MPRKKTPEFQFENISAERYRNKCFVFDDFREHPRYFLNDVKIIFSLNKKNFKFGGYKRVLNALYKKTKGHSPYRYSVDELLLLYNSEVFNFHLEVSSCPRTKLESALNKDFISVNKYFENKDKQI